MKHAAVNLGSTFRVQAGTQPPAPSYGFVTSEPNTGFFKMSDYCPPDYDIGIAWSHPEVAIDLQLSVGPMLPGRDRVLPGGSAFPVDLFPIEEFRAMVLS